MTKLHGVRKGGLPDVAVAVVASSWGFSDGSVGLWRVLTAARRGPALAGCSCPHPREAWGGRSTGPHSLRRSSGGSIRMEDSRAAVLCPVGGQNPLHILSAWTAENCFLGICHGSIGSRVVPAQVRRERIPRERRGVLSFACFALVVNALGTRLGGVPPSPPARGVGRSLDGSPVAPSLTLASTGGVVVLFS